MVGAMCLLLQRIGAVLNSFGYGLERLKGERAAVTPLPSISSRLNLKEDVKSMEYEGPYLIWILKRALGLWHRKTEPSTSASITLSNSAASSESNMGSRNDSELLNRAKVQVQNTLLQTLFSAHTTSIEDCLPGPVTPDLELDAPAFVAPRFEDMQAYFKQQVWRIVGWNVVTNAEGWV